MNKKIILGVFIAMFTAGCNGTKKSDTTIKPDSVQIADIHTAETSIDYCGEYTGTIPAADCPGINVTLILNQDKTYSLNYDYIDRKGSEFTDKGIFSVEGNLLTLKDSDGRESYYKIGEGKVRMLDADKQEITGDMKDKYVLAKVK